MKGVSSARARRLAFNILIYSMLVVWAVIVLFPFYWMVLTSVKSYNS